MMKRGLSASHPRWGWMAVAMLIAATMVVQTPGAVWAQDDDDGLPEDDFTAPPPPDKVEGEGTVDKDLNLYWGGQRREDVIIGHLYQKGGRLELGLFAGVIPNDPYLSYVPLGGRIGFFFTDSLGV
ncbi:MAG: hypothetical protein AAFX99_21490, partial [Myxococcota bacterium]